MILAIDVHYRESLAKTVCISFERWKDEEPAEVFTLELPVANDYQPGEFYKRELPCLLEILKLSDLDKVKVIIIDGYVVLDDEGKPGLGSYLYESLNKRIPVIGVAKKRFHENRKFVVEVFRGESKKPLFITCRGIELTDAAEKIGTMEGAYRVPALLKILDQKTKEE